MPRPPTSRRSLSSPVGDYAKLENRLVLLAWLNNLFGYTKNRDLLEDMKDAGEGFAADGHSFIYQRLASRGDRVLIPLDELAKYDDNVRAHLIAINTRRSVPITLRYFQYLGVLYADLFLDHYFNRQPYLLASLNEFVANRNASRAPGEPRDDVFNESDLAKIAFWIATGGGKTLIMHLNYRQFLYYNRKPLDNILLITPNEGMSEQHIREMEESGIPCSRFALGESGLGLGGRNVVRVLEITKLVEEKRGGGVTVPVEAFEGNNLIFVDEGHKGSGGEVWRSYRDALGQTGFTFEYSATFGQALKAAGDDALTTEYGKAIVFDYSYKYFYGDGFGKDFFILNLRDETTGDDTDVLLLGNLLDFYEQQRCFAEHSSLGSYNIEKPLSLFIGSTVNTSVQARDSDVLTVAKFFHRFLQNNDGWSVQNIERLIAGESGLIGTDGQDVFAGRFDYLRGDRLDANAVYQDILNTVFHAPAGGNLHLSDIKANKGELGLKVGGTDRYFGLIYIGEVRTFRNLVAESDTEIIIEEDVTADSLFAGINRSDTDVNVLVGAKKFMEGWNSWRVSNMGLLNIGRSEGSEIIQLFGRGVRLRGRGFTLKRSAVLNGNHPPHLRLLETLNIFAVRANYMVQFRDYLEREGVETFGQVELSLPIRANDDFLGKGLVVPAVTADKNFAEECVVVLTPDQTLTPVAVDMSLKVEAIRSGPIGVKTETIRAGEETPIPTRSLDLIDWDQHYLDLLEYKEQKGYDNLVIGPDALREILSADEPRLYSLIATDPVVNPKSFVETHLLRDAVSAVLRKYVDRFYYAALSRWESENMAYATLDRGDPNFRGYIVRIPQDERELIEAVHSIIAEGDRIYREELRELPNIHFDRHLYQPLLVERGDKVKSDPPGLKDSERRFVEKLRDYVRREAAASLAEKEVFLLRNLGRGRGIGFFTNVGFYPDFILWIKEGSTQRIVFVEPHGMLNEMSYKNDDKARLHLRLAELSDEWGKRAGMKGVTLDSFIISATRFEDLKPRYDSGDWTKDKFTAAHILFAEDEDYVSQLFY